MNPQRTVLFSRVVLLASGVSAAAILFAPGCRDEVDAKQAKIESLRQGVLATDSDIEFHGRVVDEDGAAIEGAEVVAQVRHYDPEGRFFMSVTEITRSTDAAGRFSIVDLAGRSLFVLRIDKEGYAVTPSTFERRAFDFGKGSPNRHQADAREPEIFVLRKRGKAEYLESIMFRKTVESMNATVRFNLRSGAARVGADERLTASGLWLEVRSSAVSETRARIDLAAPVAGDGIVLSERLLYTAPESGYSSGAGFEMRIPHQGGPRESEKRFVYFREKGSASFARLELNVHLNRLRDGRESATFFGTGYRNPAGSRILEYDSAVNSEALGRKKR